MCMCLFLLLNYENSARTKQSILTRDLSDLASVHERARLRLV